MLEISVEKVAYIIAKAREFDVKVGAQDIGPEPHPDPDDADYRDILEDYEGDPTADELHDAIAGLNEEEQVNLVALFWLGRGDYNKDDWAELLAEARDRHNKRTAEYLMGSPMLSDHIEEGLVRLGYDIEDVEG